MAAAAFVPLRLLRQYIFIRLAWLARNLALKTRLLFFFSVFFGSTQSGAFAMGSFGGQPRRLAVLPPNAEMAASKRSRSTIRSWTIWSVGMLGIMPQHKQKWSLSFEGDQFFLERRMVFVLVCLRVVCPPFCALRHWLSHRVCRCQWLLLWRL